MNFLIYLYPTITGILVVLFVVFAIAIAFDYRRERFSDILKNGGLVLLGGVGISIFWLPFLIWWILKSPTTLRRKAGLEPHQK